MQVEQRLGGFPAICPAILQQKLLNLIHAKGFLMNWMEMYGFGGGVVSSSSSLFVLLDQRKWNSAGWNGICLETLRHQKIKIGF